MAGRLFEAEEKLGSGDFPVGKPAGERERVLPVSHAVAGADPAPVAVGDVDAGGLLHGFVVGEKSRRGAVADVHEPRAPDATGVGCEGSARVFLPAS